MYKEDYKKRIHTYTAKLHAYEVVEVPSLNYLMIDGTGNPNDNPEYAHAVQALYAMSYTLKFMCKKTLGKDYSVLPLEGLWWADDMTDFALVDRSDWRWTSMILQPELITTEMFEEAKLTVAKKKDLPALPQVRFEEYTEGRAAQVLYAGPYSGEADTIRALHEFIRRQGGVLTPDTKHHHEIYLNDPSRTAPEKLRTIIRQPF